MQLDFKQLDDGSLARHRDERRVKTLEEEDHELEKYRVEEAAEEEIQPLEEEPEKEEEKDEGTEFPDTSFKMRLVSESEAKVEEPKVESSDESGSDEEGNEGDESTPVPERTDDAAVEQATPSSTPGVKGKKQAKAPAAKKQPQEEKKEASKQQPLKRGQKARLNKMKSKYKDQDDEDRELVMQFLAVSCGLVNPERSPQNKLCFHVILAGW